ncbi:TnsA-like heteromeric transposase endonuclease subunit [Nesterenkonia jeotgali]|uniref:TnsA-like heteromeric transposase endonuclease subunit n=1 Tax=Nesterenkonia jeotgali TaxID=317018 RepID=UPI0015FABD57
MSTREDSLRYCNVAGDEVTTTWDLARAHDIVDGLPVRIPPSFRRQRSYPGLFWASTHRRMLVYESLLELDRLWLADFDPTVERIATQPFEVRSGNGLDAFKHVPDIMLVEADNTVTVIDVKPEGFISKPAVKAQFDRTRSLCRTKGWNYEVFTGGDPVELRNVRALAIGRHRERIPPEHVQEARVALLSRSVALGDAIARRPASCEENMWRVAVLSCIWFGEVEADLRVPLSARTILSPRHQAT